MRNIFFYLVSFTLLTSSVFSQNPIKGIVKSIEGNPIEGAVLKYGINKKEKVTTDKDGKFLIPDLPERVVYIEHERYQRVVTLLSSLRKNSKVLLEAGPVELPLVEIDGISAYDLYKRTAYNTNKNMFANKHVTYLTHVLDTEEISGESREFYFSYISLLENSNPKEKKQNFKLWLKDFKNIQALSDSSSSVIFKERGLVFGFHPAFGGAKDFNSKLYVKKEFGDNYLIIERRANQKDPFMSTYYINKSDTTLMSFHKETSDSILANDKYKKSKSYKYKLEKATLDVDVLNINGLSYFDNITYTYQYSFLVGSKEEKVTFFLKSEMVDIGSNLPNRLKPIKNGLDDLYDELDTVDFPFFNTN